MRPTKSGKAGVATRSSWEPPMVKKLAIGAETKSPNTSGTGQSSPAQPEPPAAPTTKLGFSFEMAFPLSARLGK